jgi:hypothetical protein
MSIDLERMSGTFCISAPATSQQVRGQVTATTYGSERVLHRVKKFRRTYAGPSLSARCSFDERLHATLI